MTSPPGTRTLRRSLAVALLVAPATVAAQVSPTSPPHPTMPWTGLPTPYGQLVRYVYMPPQPVTLEYLLPAGPETPPAEEPPPSADAAARGEVRAPLDAPRDPPRPPEPQIVRQQVMVPGFYVRETTAGFHYPERWVIEQTGVGAYRWRLLPSHFVSK
ncbi:MAG TPA: hypothetical protein VFV05_18680 [Methylomirabilota bacterium]|nr:hypothetical protein [Methylomirabilota bacterium]